VRFQLSCTVNCFAHQFTLKERDIETGLDYFLARYYSSPQGRFVSPDEFSGGPIDVSVLGSGHSEKQALPYADTTNPQSLNKYQYSFNNPLRFVDPNGHNPQDPAPQDSNPGIVQRIIDATNDIIGSLLRNFERARDTMPQEDEKRPPLSMGDTQLQRYVDAKGRAMEQAHDVLLLADFSGLGTTARGVQRGNRTEIAFGVFGMVTHVAGVTSSIGKDVALSGLAREAGSSVQRSLDSLTAQLARGNLNPGIGTKNLFGNVFYARAGMGREYSLEEQATKSKYLPKPANKTKPQLSTG
jgi:RHS repeat-associated protein